MRGAVRSRRWNVGETALLGMVPPTLHPLENPKSQAQGGSSLSSETPVPTPTPSIECLLCVRHCAGHFHLLFHLIFTTIPWHETNLPLGQSLPETKSNLIPLAAFPQAQFSLAVKGILAPVFRNSHHYSVAPHYLLQASAFTPVFPPCDGHYRGEGH